MKTIKRLLYILLLTPLLAHSQSIDFQQTLSWQQILQQAKKENKYIFVDCYASWCGPCKMMDRDVYSDPPVGIYMNEHFISVKYQLDTAKQDQANIKARYADAHQILMDYKITAYPTFLFFSPDGKLVHRAMGYMDPEEFVKLARTAIDPAKQYYVQAEAYRSGKKDYPQMPELAKMARENGDPKLYQELANDYNNNFLPQLGDKELFTKENLRFIGDNLGLLHSKDKLFQLIYHHPVEADSLVHSKTYAQQVIAIIITKEEITDQLFHQEGKKSIATTNKPDWNAIINTINRKYPYGSKYADSLVTLNKLFFYSFIKDWPSFVASTEEIIRKYPPQEKGKEFSKASLTRILGGFQAGVDDAYALNFLAYYVFEGTDDKELLEKALAWIDWSLRMTDQKSNNFAPTLDTKAGILYKLGRKGEALPLEEKSYSLSKNDPTIKANLDKMKQGLPTWSQVK